MMTDGRSIMDVKKMGEDTFIHSLKNVKIIGMVGRYKDEKISAFLDHLLRSAGKTVVHIHSANHQSQDQSLEDILHSYAGTYNGELEYVVIHLPNRWSYSYDFSNISMDSIVHTFIGEYDKSENYEPSGVFKNLSPKGYAVINVDDEAYVEFTDCLQDKLVITYGLSPRATITASSIEAASNLHFTCCIQRRIITRSGFEIDPIEFPVCIPDFGRADIHYALAAIGAGLVYGISPEEIMKAFRVNDQTTQKAKYKSR